MKSPRKGFGFSACSSRWLAFLSLLLIAFISSRLQGAQLTVRLEPRWQDQPLVADALSLKNAAGNVFSVTRLSMLLSHAELQRENGQWIGAKNWVEYIDLGKGRLSFVLNGIPAERFTALRFDIGLDETLDKANAAQWPAQHPLNPDFNALHWSWRGQYVFFAIEGRYTQADGQAGGYSYHLAGQPCRSTIQVPLGLDLRSNLALTMRMHVDRVFASPNVIDITAADSTHSGNDGGLATRLADNSAVSFSVLRVEPDFSSPSPASVEAAAAASAWKPKLIADRIPPHFPPANFPADNPLTEPGIALGEKLFHDKRLSVNSTQSCASCHVAEHSFSDSRRFSIGAKGHVGVRHAMPLINLAWKPSYFWDGRARTLREQILMPIQDPTEMHETLSNVVTKLPDLAPQFAQTFGSPDVTPDRIAKAIEQFLLTLVASDSKMDRTLTAGEKLTPQEQQGFLLFFTESDPAHGIKGADCFHCHGGANFTDHQFHNNGLDDEASMRDEGLAKISGKREDRGKFMTPSLRNLTQSGPFMHDGRFTTLEEVVDHYNSGLKRSNTLDPNLAKHLRYEGLQLTNEDKAALVAFLKTLSGSVRQ